MDIKIYLLQILKYYKFRNSKDSNQQIKKFKKKNSKLGFVAICTTNDN